MKKIIVAIVIQWLLLAAQTVFACDKPQAVVIPDGRATTKQSMIDVQAAVSSYVAEMGVYLECITNEEKHARRAIQNISPETEKIRQDEHTKRYNDAIDEMERVALQFNQEAKKFREKR